MDRGKRLRENSFRNSARAPRTRYSSAAVQGPAKTLLTASSGTVDSPLSLSQANATQELMATEPTLQSCKTAILGQMVGRGLVLKRDGAEVAITSSFIAHLEAAWVPFAREVAESFLCTGVAAVAVAKVEDDERLEAAGMPAAVRRTATVKKNTRVPVCVPLATAEVHVESSLRGVCLYSKANEGSDGGCGGGGHGVGLRAGDIRVFAHSVPDAAGNLTSPVAACLGLATHAAELVDADRQARLSLAQNVVVGQERPPNANENPLNAASMFFDRRAAHDHRSPTPPLRAPHAAHRKAPSGTRERRVRPARRWAAWRRRARHYAPPPCFCFTARRARSPPGWTRSATKAWRRRSPPCCKCAAP